ncbi:MAG: DUF5672 family protein [Sphingomicrobium sp.]
MRAGLVKSRSPGPRPSLDNVTLVAVTSVALPATAAALERSIRQASFAEVLLLSDLPPPADADPAIIWRRIAKLGSRRDYSRFMLRELADHVATGHALCIQWDGFVLNGAAWEPCFLNYDYIGAVWPHFGDGKNVGNGGFSLRSRRLLDVCKNLPFDGSEPEDVVISRLCRDVIEEQGLRFAPEAVARQFAYERTAPTGREFGFHGAFNLVRYLRRGDAARTFSELEPGMLSRNERLEILMWALSRGRIKLGLTMLSRLS